MQALPYVLNILSSISKFILEDRGSCSPGLSQTHYVVEDDLEVVVLLGSQVHATICSLIFCNTAYLLPSNTGLLFFPFQIQIFMEASSMLGRKRGRGAGVRGKKAGRQTSRQAGRQASSRNECGRSRGSWPWRFRAQGSQGMAESQNSGG